MTADTEASVQQPSVELRASGACVLGWSTAAMLNTALYSLLGQRAFEGLGPGDRALLHLYDFGQGLCMGLCIALATRALEAWPRRPRFLGWGLAVAAAAGAGWLFLREDLDLVVSRITEGAESPALLVLFSALAGMIVPLTALLARLLARRRWRIIPLSGAAGLIIANYFVLVGDYPGAHLLFGAAGAAAAASAFIGVPWREKRWPTRALVGAAAVVAGAAWIIPPPSAIGAPLNGTWCSALTEMLPRTMLARAAAGAPDDATFRPSGRPTPPTHRQVVGSDAIVIYFSVDSMKAELFDGDFADRLPNFYALRDEATQFRVARSPGTQTSVTLTSLMMGTYFSQQYWTRCYVPEGKGVRVLFACLDEGVRFPELLAAHDIPTVQYAQAIWLLNEYGIARGFTEERFIEPEKGKRNTKGKWSTGADVLSAIEERLRSHGSGPLFLFYHDLDPHSPFDLGEPKRGKQQERWLGELALADRDFGRLRAVLAETGLDERTVIILTADHGESFGEHGSVFHGQNLYEEQLRVPLLIRVPHKPPQTVDDPVSLIDLGPTILDLFRLPTPGHFMGQSLVPYFVGDKPKFVRPIVSETRLKRAMVLPNGMKVIRDQRTATCEIYDLNQDPGEEHNLCGELGEEGGALMKRLDDFFEVNRIRREGYEIPYRR